MHEKKENAGGNLTVNVDADGHFVKYVKYHANPWHIMWRSFLAGAFQGLGFILGTALLLTVLGLFVKDVLSNIPFFQDLAQALNIWLENAKEIKQ
ncbi:hypothetical protein HY463_01435 [Candidatus Peregrinibacteria bacterium]|nr:hypothetical protein [Candidatus Peregrinibacteria bacterium]